MEAEQTNVNNVFIKSDLKEKIYIKPPDSIKIKKGFVLLV